MEDPRRNPGAGDEQAPSPSETAAGAFAPPPGSGRSVVVFLAALVLVVCGVAGVLLLFTEVPAWYGVLLLVIALIAAVLLGTRLRRGDPR